MDAGPDWDMEHKEPFQKSHNRRFQSKRRAAPWWTEPTGVVRVVDQFIIPQTPSFEGPIGDAVINL